MFTGVDPHSLTLAGVAHHCARESERFFQRQNHDPRYCFELFRRAILQRDSQAWSHIYSQYQPLVTGWVRRHPAFPISGEETQYFVNRAFEKMWGVLTPEKFAGFADLQSILRYLQMSVHSVIVDYGRAKEQTIPLVEAMAVGPDQVTGSSMIEDQVQVRVAREALWQWLSERLKDEKEERVIYGSFVLALKPRELYRQFQDSFSDVGEIYRIKENVMARLRRDSEGLKEFLGDA